MKGAHLKGGGLIHTGMRYKITFLKLSKTRRPNSIAAGIEEKSLFNKMIEADLNNEIMKETRHSRMRTSFLGNVASAILTHNIRYQAFGENKGRTFP